MPRWVSRWVAVFLTPLMLATSCGYGPMPRRLETPSDVARLGPDQGYLKAHLRDGGVALLTSWHVDEAARVIRGEGWRFDESRSPGVRGPIELPLDSVALFESNLAPERLHPAVQALLVVVGLGVVLALAAVISVAVFGSCPTFYVSDGANMVLAAEGFSSSVTPSLEATDLDAMPQAWPRGRDLEVVMKNEMLETHVLRAVRVVAVPRNGAMRVFATSKGRFVRADGVSAPLRATAPEGDCTALVGERDGQERCSAADSSDLAARETLELDFEPVSGSAGLVVSSRLSLVTTYLFYRALAWMGRMAPGWLAALESAPPRVRRGAADRLSVLDRIRVEVHDGKRWLRAGEIRETGPLAVDECVLPLPRVEGGVRRVRLTMAKGVVRLDRVALASLTGSAEGVRLEPIEIQRTSIRGTDTLMTLPWFPRPLVTLPGDRYSFRYRLPQGGGGHELFLESRGYYLEWIRDDWLAEQDPRQVMSMLSNPRAMLRALAPAYVRGRAELEERFWKGHRAGP